MSDENRRMITAFRAIVRIADDMLDPVRRAGPTHTKEENSYVTVGQDQSGDSQGAGSNTTGSGVEQLGSEGNGLASSNGIVGRFTTVEHFASPWRTYYIGGGK